MSDPTTAQVFAHWGLFHPQVRDGRVTTLTPSGDDPNPTGFGISLVDAVHSPSRFPGRLGERGPQTHVAA